MKIALMCFSTARLVRTSDSAIASLLLPCAISASVSRSRGVSAASGESAPLAAALHEQLDDLRVDVRAALVHGADGVDELPAVVDALLEQVGAPRGAALEQR